MIIEYDYVNPYEVANWKQVLSHYLNKGSGDVFLTAPNIEFLSMEDFIKSHRWYRQNKFLKEKLLAKKKDLLILVIKYKNGFKVASFFDDLFWKKDLNEEEVVKRFIGNTYFRLQSNNSFLKVDNKMLFFPLDSLRHEEEEMTTIYYYLYNPPKIVRHKNKY